MSMNKYNDKGVIGLKSLDPSSIEAGTIGLIYVDYKPEIVTFEHMDRDGGWYVLGTKFSKVISDTTVYRIQVMCDSGTFPVEVNSWKKIIKDDLLNINERSLHEFIIKPYKFREGKYHQCCSACNSYFLAAKSQPYCKGCCYGMATAKLASVNQQSKKKRPRLKKSSEVENLLLEAFNMGTLDYPREDFQEWLQKKLKNLSLWQ